MNNGQLVFEADVECTHCGGTGIYKGMAEGKGAGVICYHCNGTGCMHVEHVYTKFEKRIERKDIERLYKTAGGYGIRADDYTTKEGKLIKFSEAGVSYAEWLQGGVPKPIKDLHCPLMHYEQGTKEGEWLKRMAFAINI